MWTEAASAPAALRAEWVKRRYVIENERLVPVPGGHAERYDPFSAYYGTDAAVAGRSLYLSLVDLDLSDSRAIEDFASTWGLLGLFQHGLLQVRRPYQSGNDPSKDPDEHGGLEELHERFETPGFTSRDRSRVVCQDIDVSTWFYIGDDADDDRSLMRDLGEADPYLHDLMDAGCVDLNFEQGRVFLKEGKEDEFERTMEKVNVRRYEQWRASRAYPKGSVLHWSPDGIVEETPIDVYYSKYFPLEVTAPATVATAKQFLAEWEEQRHTLLPALAHGAFDQLDEALGRLTVTQDLQLMKSPPMRSPIFWDALSEPISEFIPAAVHFQAAFNNIEYVTANPKPLADYEDQRRRQYLRDTFARELRLVSPTVSVSDDLASWDWSWQFPSLLSAAYTMMFLDFVAQKRKLRRCANETCGKSFVTDRLDRKYCTDRCQNAQKQRQHRRANAKPKGASQ